MFADDVTILFFPPVPNMMPDADGRPLMIIIQMQSKDYQTQMDSELKLSVQIVVLIWVMYLKENI